MTFLQTAFVLLHFSTTAVSYRSGPCKLGHNELKVRERIWHFWHQLSNRGLLPPKQKAPNTK